MKEKPKRVFFVCRQKKCVYVKDHGVSCTVSGAVDQGVFTEQFIGTRVAENMNRRRLCIHFTEDQLKIYKFTPEWKLSQDKPGLRKQTQNAKEDELDFYRDNPDFLEVV